MRPATLLLATVCALPLAAPAQRIVSLDRPGVLEAIEADNPGHHQRIVGILRASAEMPCDYGRLARAQVDHEAREAKCSVFLFTSYPAKRQLSFLLDDTRYLATVTMRADGTLMKVPTGR